MKLYTPQFANSTTLIKSILQTHTSAGFSWLFLKDLDCGDKRANFGLFLHGGLSLLQYFMYFYILTQTCVQGTTSCLQRTDMKLIALLTWVS